MLNLVFPIKNIGTLIQLQSNGDSVVSKIKSSKTLLSISLSWIFSIRKYLSIFVRKIPGINIWKLFFPADVIPIVICFTEEECKIIGKTPDYWST